MISYKAFFNELEKIAEAQDDTGFVTRDKLIRLAKVVGAAGLGGGLGLGAGALVRRLITKNPESWAQNPWLMKVLPTVIGAGSGALGMLQATHGKKTREYIEKGHEGKRPEQPRL